MNGFGRSDLSANRHVNPEGTGNRPISEVEIAAIGTVVHLKGYGLLGFGLEGVGAISPNFNSQYKFGEINYKSSEFLQLLYT